MQTQKRQALRKLLGSDEAVQQVLASAEQKESQANAAGVRYKERHASEDLLAGVKAWADEWVASHKDRGVTDQARAQAGPAPTGLEYFHRAINGQLPDSFDQTVKAAAAEVEALRAKQALPGLAGLQARLTPDDYLSGFSAPSAGGEASPGGVDRNLMRAITGQLAGPVRHKGAVVDLGMAGASQAVDQAVQAMRDVMTDVLAEPKNVAKLAAVDQQTL